MMAALKHTQNQRQISATLHSKMCLLSSVAYQRLNRCSKYMSGLARSQCNWINQLDPLVNEITHSLTIRLTAWISYGPFDLCVTSIWCVWCHYSPKGKCSEIQEGYETYNDVTLTSSQSRVFSTQCLQEFSSSSLWDPGMFLAEHTTF